MLHLEIITPDQTVYDGQCVSVTLPTGDGEITVLERHIPLVTTITPGSAVVRDAAGEMQIFAVSRGFIELDGKNVRILTDIADRVEELEEEQIRKAKERAETLMTEKRADAEEFAEAVAVLDRELARLRTVRRYRPRSLPFSDRRPS